jgi:hypothetical protein
LWNEGGKLRTCGAFLVSVLLLIFVTVSSSQSKDSSIATINELHKRALILLSAYNLNPVNKTLVYNESKTIYPLPLKRSFVLDTTESKPVNAQSYSALHFKQLKDVSEKIGLNPSLYMGKRCIRLNYLLRDSTQANTTITAHILFSDTNLVGAYLVFGGSSSGIVSLNDRSQFNPKDFTFPKFNPDLLDTVSIVGPWDKSGKGCGWINRVDLLSKADLLFFAKTLATSKKIKGELRYTVFGPIEEYAIPVHFKTGERFCPHFIFRNDTVYLNAYKCYFILDKEFMNFVNESIKVRGTNICKSSPSVK